MLRFGNVKNSSAINIASVPASSAQFRSLVDESVRRLLMRGDWDGTVVPIHVCITQANCIVWPRYVGHVRKMNLCRSGVPINNVWYDFLPYNNNQPWNSWWGTSGSYYWNRWFGPTASIVTQANSPVFSDIMGDDRTLRAYISTPLDNNKKLYIFGEDNGGQRLMTKGLGGWTDGIVLNLNAASYTESKDATGTALKVRRIERVVKDETQGPVRLYAWNTASSVLEDVAYYEPTETEPSYVRSQLHSSCCSTSTSPRSIVALVKLQYVPIRSDNDWVLVDNLEAIKNMMQSIRSEDAGDLKSKASYEAAAIRALNLQLADSNPDDQIPVDFGSMGRNGSSIGQQRCF